MQARLVVKYHSRTDIGPPVCVRSTRWRCSQIWLVNSAPGFSDQPKVVNGASELLGELFGEAGLHARAAVACNELPLDSAVEVEIIAVVKT